MRYTNQDFIADVSFCFRNKDYGIQNPFKSIYMQKLNSHIELNPYENEILKLNQIIRVDSVNRTPYILHMSYPSARSIYKIKMYIVKEDKLCSTDIWGNPITYQIPKEWISDLSGADNSIIIQALPLDEERYVNIQKTLQILEVGHLLYNVTYIASLYGYTISFDNKCPEELVMIKLKQNKKIDDLNKIDLSLKEFWEKAYLRTSGKYYGGLMDFSNAQDSKYLLENHLSHHITLQRDMWKYIKILRFVNNNNGEYSCIEENISVSYEDLSKEYSYVNFRTATQITLYFISKDALFQENIADLIQYIGFLAQDTCINNAKANVYNRPVKQVMHLFWNPILKTNNTISNYIPFYGVLTGKESSLEVSQNCLY